MFGKNYDDKIASLTTAHNNLVQNTDEVIGAVNNLNSLLSTLNDTVKIMTDSMIKMAGVQAQHKAIIVFLLRHATVDADSQEDLQKMMQEILNFSEGLE